MFASWDRDDQANGTESRPSLELCIWLTYDINTARTYDLVDYAFDATNSSAARRYYTLPPHLTVVPQVERVTSLYLGGTPGRAMHPATLCQLAASFPNLEGLVLHYQDPAVKRHEMRKEHQVAIGKGLKALSNKLPRLEKLCIWRDFWKTSPEDHSFACGDLQEEGVAIRHLAQTCGQLRELDLENIMISPDLFRAADQPPTFPHLERLRIDCGIVAPSGKWYYTGDPAAVEAAEEDSVFDDDDSDDENNAVRDRFVNGERPRHEWRTRPDPDTFDALVRDMTTAMLKGGAVSRIGQVGDALGVPQARRGHYTVLGSWAAFRASPIQET